MDDRFGVDALLAPLADGVGPDPRGGGGAEPNLYLIVKDARGEARLAERDALVSGDPDADPLKAGGRGWSIVADSGARLLCDRAKDLQVAAWITEAWLRIGSFPGAAAGFALMAGLIERYWEAGLHPQADEDGDETRIAPLFGLFGQGDAGTLLQPLKLLPLSDHSPPLVALGSVETIQAQSTRHDDPEVAEQLAERRQTQLAGIEAAIRRASPEFAQETAAGIADALAQLDRLMAAVDARTPFGRFGSQVAQPLEDAQRLLRAHGTEPADGSAAGPPPATIRSPAADAPAPAAAADRAAAVSQHDAMDRERALATLLEVAAFFERNEPHSLVGQGLRDVVRRARLPLDALLAELLPDDEQRALFLLRAGIRNAPSDDSGY